MADENKEPEQQDNTGAFSTAAPMDFVARIRGKPVAEVEADIRAVKERREAEDRAAAEKKDEKPAAKPAKK